MCRSEAPRIQYTVTQGHTLNQETHPRKIERSIDRRSRWLLLLITYIVCIDPCPYSIAYNPELHYIVDPHSNRSLGSSNDAHILSDLQRDRHHKKPVKRDLLRRQGAREGDYWSNIGTTQRLQRATQWSYPRAKGEVGDLRQHNTTISKTTCQPHPQTEGEVDPHQHRSCAKTTKSTPKHTHRSQQSVTGTGGDRHRKS